MLNIDRFLGAYLFAVLVSLSSAHLALAQDVSLQSRYNEAVDQVVKEISQIKSQYPELENFSKTAVHTDLNGFQEISYARTSSANPDPYAYKFSIVLKSTDDTVAPESASSWEIDFPLLGKKVVVETPVKGPEVSFDLRRIVENSLDGIRAFEQESLPFRLELSSDKRSYAVLEEILLTVSLVNMGNKPYKVADLDENSLDCAIGDAQWGNSEGGGELNTVLSGRGKIEKVLRLNGSETPQDMAIACTYALGYKGVRPYSRIKIPIHSRK